MLHTHLFDCLFLFQDAVAYLFFSFSFFHNARHRYELIILYYSMLDRESRAICLCGSDEFLDVMTISLDF